MGRGFASVTIADLESGIERLSEREIPRVSGQRRPHLARHVGVSDAGRRIRKTHGTTCAR